MQKAVLKVQTVADMTQQLRNRRRNDRNERTASFRKSSKEDSYSSSFRGTISPEKRFTIKEDQVSVIPTLSKEMHGENIMISEPRSLVVSTMQPNLRNRILVRKSRNQIEKDNSTKIKQSNSMATLTLPEN